MIKTIEQLEFKLVPDIYSASAERVIRISLKINGKEYHREHILPPDNDMLSWFDEYFYLMKMEILMDIEKELKE